MTWVVWEDKEGGDAEDDSGQAFDDQDPAPASLAGYTVHMPDAEGEKTSACSCQCGRYEEVADSQG